MILLREVPSVVGSRKGWELYITPTVTPPVAIYSSYPSLPPTTLGTSLNRIMFDSLMVAF
jgi:hypothetical protein